MVTIVLIAVFYGWSIRCGGGRSALAADTYKYKAALEVVLPAGVPLTLVTLFSK